MRLRRAETGTAHRAQEGVAACASGMRVRTRPTAARLARLAGSGAALATALGRRRRGACLGGADARFVFCGRFPPLFAGVKGSEIASACEAFAAELVSATHATGSR